MTTWRMHGCTIHVPEGDGDSQAAIYPPIYRLHPRIMLEHCHLCGGSGTYPTWRNHKPVLDVCTNCAGRGTIVRDAA